MQIISSCTILLMMILNILCTEKTSWTLNFTRAEITAVPGLCALVSCTFTYPDKAISTDTIMWKKCDEKVQCSNDTFTLENVKKIQNNEQDIKSEQVEMLESDPSKQNCSFILSDIKADDEGEYQFRVGDQNKSRKVKLIIQDKPVMEVPPLREGEQANLSCSAPSPCPETPPHITWWIEKRDGEITDVNNVTTSTTSEGLNSTLTLTPTSELHNATVGCDVSYGHKRNISANKTIKVMGNETDKTENGTNHLNNVFNAVLDFMAKTTTHVFLMGMATSAVIFSLILCCWVSCKRAKKVQTAPADSAVDLKMVQTDIDLTVTNEQTPLHNQSDAGMSSTPVESTGGAEETEAGEENGAAGGAEETEAGGREDGEAGGAEDGKGGVAAAGDVDYAAIDYSLIKNKSPEEGESKSMDTEYAEIRRDWKEWEALQNEHDHTEDQKQNEEESLYSNTDALKGQA